MDVAKGYRQLQVWQTAMTLVEHTYALTYRLPSDQRFSLADQMQRAAVSVPSNIAEGHAKKAGRDYARHLRIAAGSLAELETQLVLAVRLGFVTREEVREAWSTSQTAAKMLSSLIKSVSLNTPKKRPKKRDRTAP